MYRVYTHMGMYGGIQMYNGHTDVWGGQMYGGMYRSMGHSNVWGVYICLGVIQTYVYKHTDEYTDVWGCTDVWRMYRCMRVYRCIGHRHKGGVWGLQTYKWHTDVWRCTEVWEAYICMRDVQMYGVYRCVGSHRHP